jgi:glycosyltransferase involved in cell wall biosynthesis
MRFLMLNWRDPRNPLAGGAERVTLGYLSALARRGHQVYWFAHSFDGAPPEETLEGVRIIRKGGKKSAVYEAFRWYRRQPRFDLVIDQHHGMPWYAPWWCRTNCVAYIHEVLGPIWDAFYQWPYNVIGRHQERWTHWLYRNVPFWTACSSTKTALEEMGVRDITLIPYGVHTQALPTLEVKPLELPLKLVVVSRLAPNKRVDHALRAFKNVRAAGVEAWLTVVGSGVVERELMALASELGLGDRVLFTRSLPEKQKDECLRRAHLLLHTSMREGWGLNVIEANAMGTPAIVYPVPGLIESTLHEQTGLVATAEDPESLSAAILGALNEPEKYQNYRRRAWERARTFHWDQVLPPACAWLEAQAAKAADAES